MRFENIPTTLTLLKELTNQSSSPLRHMIDGIAIYCEWMATPENWEQIKTHWTEPKN